MKIFGGDLVQTPVYRIWIRSVSSTVIFFKAHTFVLLMMKDRTHMKRRGHCLDMVVEDLEWVLDSYRGHYRLGLAVKE